MPHSTKPPESNRAEIYKWHQRRLAEDIPVEPTFGGSRVARLDAWMNWADLKRFGEDLRHLFPEALFIPATYLDFDPRIEHPADSAVPIYRDILDCLKDPTHGYVPTIIMRWPWADEVGSDNPDVLSGRIHGVRSPWLDSPWGLPTKWAHHRRRGRLVRLAVHFKGYQHVQKIRTWNGDSYWAAEFLPEGRRISDLIPDSWCFNMSGYSTLKASYLRSEIDNAYFCEAVLRLWRKHSTPHIATYDGLTGQIVTDNQKSYEMRYGWNALKHGIDGSRRFISARYRKLDGRLFVSGPITKDAKKVAETADCALDFEDRTLEEN